MIKNDSASSLDRTKRSSRVFCVALVSLFLVVYTNAFGQQLHDDAKKGNVGEVERLIEEGADVNAKDEGGNTPLHWAAFYGNAPMAELLIKNGAKVNAQNKLRATPLHVAAFEGKVVMAELLINMSADVDARKEGGFTPLHDAASMGHAAMAELLIREGADVNAREKIGATPLHHAATLGHTSVAELLIRKGAKVNARNKRRFTPLHGAALMGNAAVAELLIRRSAQVNARAEDGGTPLHGAAFNGHLNVVEILIRMGADVNAKNRDGETPLNWAAHKGHKRVVELLRAQEIPGCKMSDLSIDATIPKGYTRIPTECPKVAYKRNLNPNHALGFYIIETSYPYHSSGKKSLSETVDDYILIVRVKFDIALKGQSYNTQQIYENADYPPSLVDHGGACGGLVARTPEFYQGREGVEWRRGIMCLVELPPTGSEKWTLIQAFFFDKNLERTDYKPKADFEQVARRLFRSIRIKGLEEDNGLRRIQ